jgi:hypothetical protein
MVDGDDADDGSRMGVGGGRKSEVKAGLRLTDDELEELGVDDDPVKET